MSDAQQLCQIDLSQPHLLADAAKFGDWTSHKCVYTHDGQSAQQELCVPVLGGTAPRGYRRAMGKSIAVKIRQLRLVLGINQTELAERLGVTQASVSRWEKGSMPDTKHLVQLAELADTDVKTFIDELNIDAQPSSSLNRFEVRGVVAAGVWAEAYEWPQEDWLEYSGGEHYEAPVGTRYGLRVEGVSMNMVYPAGTIVDCVQVEAFGQLKSGNRVIVERKRRDGDIEATVKEYTIAQDGREWLVPKSYDPAFQTAIAVDDPGEDIVEIKIVAVVVGSYRPE